jgi:protein-S-isoprenylcysteine O-methyltransferase Ste14
VTLLAFATVSLSLFSPQEKMTSWGIGPKLAFFSILYGLFIFTLHLHYGARLRIGFLPYRMLATVGIALIVIGMIFFAAARRSFKSAFDAGILCTRGVYGMCRHPVYAAWVVFLVPGLVLLINSWAGLTMPPVMYVILKILVSKEEQCLDQRFGNEYRSYKKRVPAVLPLGWLTRKWN